MYVPHLIPEEHRVLTDYFNENTDRLSNSKTRKLSWLITLSKVVIALLIGYVLKTMLIDTATPFGLSPESAESHYQRALEYREKNRLAKAVAELRLAIDMGHAQAEDLHNQLNPIVGKKKVYVNQCCDGTISEASGQGACSHHGGVCNEKYIVYKDRRKFD